MASLVELREQLEMHNELLAATNEFLQHDPTDAETLQSQAETKADIARLETQIKALIASSDKSNSSLIPGSPAPSSTTSKHAAPPPPPSSNTATANVVSFSVGDHVQAKWSEDQSFYPAIVLSKTGNPNNPQYTVKFTGYGNTETKKANELRAVDSSKKRKAEDPPRASSTTSQMSHAPPPPPPPPPPPSSSSTKPGNDGAFISAAPSVDASLAKKRVPSMVSDGPTRLPREPKKLKSNKALDSAKNTWQAFQKSGPKVSGSMSAPKQKESQFRVGNQPGAKVGFTGSGKGMQKDTTRPLWKGNAVDD